MKKGTNIQWTNETWNVAVGCDKVDSDCLYCYMYRDSMNGTRYVPNEVRKTTTVFDKPLKLKEPSLIFTSSLTDFFHPKIDPFRNEAWDIIRQCPQHTFQILTKRPERILQCLPDDWAFGWPNVWLGTSAGSNKGMNRVFDLVQVPALTRFVSIEPLYEKIDTKAAGLKEVFTSMIDWMIVGGESGNDTGKYRYRPCELLWIEELCAFGKQTSTAVFVKQLGTSLSKEMGLSDRHGGNWDEWPECIKIRNFPK
ncbi:MAG: DUF5131 family protein [Notoacmeibacter sp.]